MLVYGHTFDDWYFDEWDIFHDGLYIFQLIFLIIYFCQLLLEWQKILKFREGRTLDAMFIFILVGMPDFCAQPRSLLAHDAA